MDHDEIQQMDNSQTVEEQPNEFQTLKERLAEIVTLVDSDDISLDQALDLYEEAVVLGLQATDLLDVDITAQEEAQTRILAADSEQSAQQDTQSRDIDATAGEKPAGEDEGTTALSEDGDGEDEANNVKDE